MPCPALCAISERDLAAGVTNVATIDQPTSAVVENWFMLIERRVDFANGYRMRCESCRASSWLTAEDYAGSPEAMMTCSSCGGEFNFGPAVVDLRGAEDAALDDTRLPQLAWYHTTTDHGWPLPSKPLTAGKLEALRKWGWPEERLDSYRRRHESQALHLGTYEAAIESMLRRMRNQGDRNSQFYLHRVRLREGLAIEPAWRDENSAEAAATTSIDLAFQGVDVIRHLNAHESIGSLSIAIVRGAIDSVQRVDVPISQLVERLDDATLKRAGALRDEVHAVEAKHSNDPMTTHDRLRKRHVARAGEPFAKSPAPETYAALAELERFVEDKYLGGVSPVIRRDFMQSVGSPRTAATYEKDLVWLNKFMGLAALLTRHEQVREVLAGQSWQTVQPTL